MLYMAPARGRATVGFFPRPGLPSSLSRQPSMATNDPARKKDAGWQPHACKPPLFATRNPRCRTGDSELSEAGILRTPAASVSSAACLEASYIPITYTSPRDTEKCRSLRVMMPGRIHPGRVRARRVVPSEWTSAGRAVGPYRLFNSSGSSLLQPGLERGIWWILVFMISVLRVRYVEGPTSDSR